MWLISYTDPFGASGNEVVDYSPYEFCKDDANLIIHSYYKLTEEETADYIENN